MQRTVKSSIKGAVQSVCKQRLCLHFGIQNIEFYSTTIYIFMILEYNKLSRDCYQALQERKSLNLLKFNTSMNYLYKCTLNHSQNYIMLSPFINSVIS